MANYHYEIGEVVRLGLEDNEYWRTITAARFPSDNRNSDAAKVSGELGGSISINWRNQYANAMQLLEFQSSIWEAAIIDMSAAESELFRSIGFGFNPLSLDDVAEALCEAAMSIAAKRLGALEARLRRKAKSLDYRLVKSRAKDASANNQLGYMLVANFQNVVADGDRYDMTLVEVAERLERDSDRPQ